MTPSRALTGVRIALTLIAPLAILCGPFFLNRVQPFVLGLPFLMFWISAWTVGTALAMGLVYWLDPRRRAAPDEPG
ncbi:MAG: DUF3311 domain-containing protein [Gammaproteobacteria bacterium]